MRHHRCFPLLLPKALLCACQPGRLRAYGSGASCAFVLHSRSVTAAGGPHLRVYMWTRTSMSSVALVAALLSMQSMVGDAVPRSLKATGQAADLDGLTDGPTVPRWNGADTVWNVPKEPCGHVESDPCPLQKYHDCGEFPEDTVICQRCIQDGEEPDACGQTPTLDRHGIDCTCFAPPKPVVNPDPNPAGCEDEVMDARCRRARNAKLGECLSCLTNVPACNDEGAILAVENYCRNGVKPPDLMPAASAADAAVLRRADARRLPWPGRLNRLPRRQEPDRPEPPGLPKQLPGRAGLHRSRVPCADRWSFRECRPADMLCARPRCCAGLRSSVDGAALHGDYDRRRQPWTYREHLRPAVRGRRNRRRPVERPRECSCS